MLSIDQKDIVHKWLYSYITADDNNVAISKGEKAILKRCNGITDIILNKTFVELWQKIIEGEDKYAKNLIVSLAVIVGVTSFIKPGSKKSLAEASSQSRTGSKDDPMVSNLRFTKLVNSTSPDEFLTNLRRILTIINGNVNADQLADEIDGWISQFYQSKLGIENNNITQNISFKWLSTYYK